MVFQATTSNEIQIFEKNKLYFLLGLLQRNPTIVVYSEEEKTGLGVEGKCRRTARKVDKEIVKMKYSPYECCHNIHGGGITPG